MATNSLPNLLYPYASNRAMIHVYKRFHQRTTKECISNQIISRISYYYEDDISCPICLEEPTLPRMDKCGHIFCLGCLIKLCQYGENMYILCPACKSYRINPQNSKRVTVLRSTPVKVGEVIMFQLLAKGKSSKFPDILFDMPDPFPYAPLSSNPISAYTPVSVDTDNEVQADVRRDLSAIEQRKNSLNPNEKRLQEDIISFLYTELREFNLNLKENTKIRNTDLAYAEKTANCFNFTKNLGEQLGQFDLFYQSPNRAFVMLEHDQTIQVMKRDKDTENGFRADISGVVTTVRTIKMTPALQNESNFLHIPIGATTTLVTINTNTLRYKYPPMKSFERATRYRNTFEEEEKQWEEQRRQSQEKQNELKAKGLTFTPMINSFTTDGPPYLQNLGRDTNPESFNLCLFGLECDDPDDDYPHDVMCYRYHDAYRRKESHENFFMEDDPLL